MHRTAPTCCVSFSRGGRGAIPMLDRAESAAGNTDSCADEWQHWQQQPRSPSRVVPPIAPTSFHHHFTGHALPEERICKNAAEKLFTTSVSLLYATGNTLPARQVAERGVGPRAASGAISCNFRHPQGHREPADAAAPALPRGISEMSKVFSTKKLFPTPTAPSTNMSCLPRPYDLILHDLGVDQS